MDVVGGAGNRLVYNNRCFPGRGTKPRQDSGVNAYLHDYFLVLTYLQDYQRRIDRLTTVATAVISIDDSRHGYESGKNVDG